MKPLLRITASTAGEDRRRITLSLTRAEFGQWASMARRCDLKVNRWAIVSVNRLLSGIPPVRPKK